MSWDVILMKFSKDVNKVEDIDESIIENLGSREVVVNKLSLIFPDADFTDKSWGTLNREGYSIEINISEDCNINSIMLQVRGDNRAILAIKKICDETNWKAIDEEILNFDNKPERGLEQWQTYRQQVINGIEKK
ncbi:hypothetical protein ACX93W_21735 [Paenibacillus sp. CAU 1782]